MGERRDSTSIQYGLWTPRSRFSAVIFDEAVIETADDRSSMADPRTERAHPDPAVGHVEPARLQVRSKLHGTLYLKGELFMNYVRNVSKTNDRQPSTRRTIRQPIRLLALTAALAWTVSASAQKLGHLLDPAAYPQAGIVGITPNGILLFDGEHELSPAETLTLLSEYLGLTPYDELVSTEQETDSLGITRERFMQYHRGVPVDRGEIVAISNEGRLLSMRGNLASGLAFDPSHAMLAAEARSLCPETRGCHHLRLAVERQ